MAPRAGVLCIAYTTSDLGQAWSRLGLKVHMPRMIVLIDRTGREAGLGGAIRDQSPSGEHGLRLRLEAASFDALVAWLGNLQQQYGVKVEAATVDAAAAPGLVNASLTLTHGATPGS